jgi:hypothetical protein
MRVKEIPVFSFGVKMKKRKSIILATWPPNPSLFGAKMRKRQNI